MEDNYKLARELQQKEQELVAKQKRADALFEQELARSQSNDEFAKGTQESVINRVQQELERKKRLDELNLKQLEESRKIIEQQRQQNIELQK